ncbi:thioredoxin family protein [Desulfobacca acetoxidans]|uniref:Thioredoxin domain-containing protein n=1 Tax=Desulfobacca acetoxidans (strain ATCC 700848 / DSM 11109 / ASRB2) TaxID=880072 RepID=F2NJ70_DESAR|nr:thioredoxin family protein [Desulfobacca acetoxidans]AEB09242.1 hypothetical protein Desac_1386 [Desulfobacca acetoxidans DSM 11109]
MKKKQLWGRIVGGLIMLFLFAGLSALPVQAGIVDGNTGKGGEKCDLKPFIKPGQTTVIDFTSPFCPPCEKLLPVLETLAGQRSDLHIVKLNINRPSIQGAIDWESPLYKQHSLPYVPFLMIYNGQGQLQSKGREALDTVLKWYKATQGQSDGGQATSPLPGTAQDR